jgi:hypothetical protein
MGDVTLTCHDCGHLFEVTYEQQRRNRERKLPKQFCPACRERRRHARDAGMKSEVGQPASFSVDQKPQRDRRPEKPQSASTSSRRPDLPLARPPQMPHRASPAPGRQPTPPARWFGLDLLRIAAFVWVVVTLIMLRRFGVPAAALVGGAGVALAIWRSSKR